MLFLKILMIYITKCIIHFTTNNFISSFKGTICVRVVLIVAGGVCGFLVTHGDYKLLHSPLHGDIRPPEPLLLLPDMSTFMHVQ